MLAVSRAIIAEVKSAVRTQHGVPGCVPQVLCLLQAWTSALRYFLSLLSPAEMKNFQTVDMLAKELGEHATFLCGGHALGDMTSLQDAVLPDNFQDQLNQNKDVLNKELDKLPSVVAHYAVQLPSCSAFRLDNVCEGTASLLQDFMQTCGDVQPNESVLKLTEALCTVRVLVVELQCLESIPSGCKARLMIASGGS